MDTTLLTFTCQNKILFFLQIMKKQKNFNNHYEQTIPKSEVTDFIIQFQVE